MAVDQNRPRHAPQAALHVGPQACRYWRTTQLTWTDLDIARPRKRHRDTSGTRKGHHRNAAETSPGQEQDMPSHMCSAPTHYPCKTPSLSLLGNYESTSMFIHLSVLYQCGLEASKLYLPEFYEMWNMASPTCISHYIACFIHHPLRSASSASLVAGLLTKTRDLSQSPLHIFQACLDSIIVLSSTERNDTDKVNCKMLRI